jgi:predicted ATPase
VLFARLSVFVGGCSLQAIEAVCDVHGDLPVDTLDGVESLVIGSLLRQEESEGEPRFYMLETIREYALERLEEGGEAEKLRRRHAGHFLELAEEAEPQLRDSEPAEWLQRLEKEHDNLRAASPGRLSLARPTWECGSGRALEILAGERALGGGTRMAGKIPR